MATRTPKRELAPDWRDSMRDAVRRFVVRISGALVIGLALATAVALATHHSTDPSLTTAAGGPPDNMAGQPGAYLSDALLVMFGMPAILFCPIIALAGMRMLRLAPAGRVFRALLLAALGALLFGTALGMTSASAVSGLPGGWGGALGFAAANGVNAAVGLIHDP
ncbi:MAG: DNA translocase FtsK 4TM domain-containing protein, partial [Sphingomicrobium sp.]